VTFVTALALAIATLVALPVLAHRLRRKRAEEQPFAGAHLVPPAPPRARSRARLEDRALFTLRALAVVALALLGASPLVRCSRLSMQRSSGASMALAIVVDDSMSMRAPYKGRTRFQRAKEAAGELIAGAREGDAVAIVLAGSPPRVALAATTDLAAAQVVVDGLTESDRATDVEGALRIGEGLVAELPQIDRRVVLLSDCADGHADDGPLGAKSGLPVWNALPEIAGEVGDCAVLSADDLGGRVRVDVRCNAQGKLDGRDVVVRRRESGEEVGRAPAVNGAPTVVTLAKDAAPNGTELVAFLLPGSAVDAITTDDQAPVLVEGGPGALAIVVDTAAESTVTGGAPVLEQALTALRLEMTLRPLPAIPERKEDLETFAALLVDDAPGLTPEQRRALGPYLEEGGVVLFAFGPRSASAPLGATFEPLLAHGVLWRDTNAPGADLATSKDVFGEGTKSLADLAATKRAVLDPADVAQLDPIVPWKDGAPLVARRTIGRGEAWLVTLPFSLDASDLPLRPGFLSMLDAFVLRARARSAPRRTEVGQGWAFDRVSSATGPAGPVETRRDQGRVVVVPGLLGRYVVKDGDRSDVRVAAPAPAELDFRARPFENKSGAEHLGESHAQVDVSSKIALALLALILLELIVRVRKRSRADDVAEGTGTNPPVAASGDDTRDAA
jgi:hypothetical protein